MKWLFSLAFASLANASQEVEDKHRPVTKVINLLKDMQKNLQKEAEDDEATYNKLACWCETNDREKTQAIKDAQEKIEQLQARIEELTATSARLNAEIENLTDQIAKATDALAQAKELRKKEYEEFNDAEKDTLQSISALTSAVKMLSKHNGGAPSESLVHIATIMRHITFNNPDVLSEPQMKVVTAFMQAPEKDYLDAAPTFKASYSNQSGEIFGILENMLETFEANLKTSQKEEQAAQKAFEELKAAKENEIAEATSHKNQKNDELATTDENNVTAKEDLEGTTETLSADEKYLMNLKEKCKMTDDEWEQRQKTRTEEIQAVSEALQVLSSDDAHDTFTRTFNFLQTGTVSVSAQRELAASVLSKAAFKLDKPVLSTLATQVRLDAFVRVKAAIDDMIKKLLKEKADEIKHKDFCNEEMNLNEKTTAIKSNKAEALTTSIDNLAAEIATLKAEIEAHEATIAELNVQLKRAGEDRTAENIEFQATVADQKATQELLKKALAKLNQFYAKKEGLLQEPAGPPPPTGFKPLKSQDGQGGVVALINQIIGDAKNLEAEAVQAETDAQAAYEVFVQDTNTSNRDNQRSIVAKSETKANKETDKAEQEAELSNTKTEIEELETSMLALHKACDFVVKNFDIRQTARDEEVEALRQAKAILSGSEMKAAEE